MLSFTQTHTHLHMNVEIKEDLSQTFRVPPSAKFEARTQG